MKRLLLIPIYLGLCYRAKAQDEGSFYTAFVHQVEVQAERDEIDKENDSFFQQMEYYRKHPLNLNTASEEEVAMLPALNAIQVKNFVSYRRLFGKLLNIYELQAIPGWDLDAIRSLIPFISIDNPATVLTGKGNWLRTGQQSLLISAGTTIEKAKGFQKVSDSSARYEGSRMRLLMRYRYDYKSRLQWGFTGEKDAGEAFFKGSHPKGFDFYSFHIFARGRGLVQSVAAGDFTVNMGQGLVQWEGASFRKSAEIAAVKRVSPVLSPYSSAGETGYHRGFGISLQKGHWQSSLFISLQKISPATDSDTSINSLHITSLAGSGYHRTASEIAGKNRVQQFSAGATFGYTTQNFQLSFNAVQYRFSLPVQKQDRPYNLFSLRGDVFTNTGISYSYIFKNIHHFGEAAVDRQGSTAFLNGFLVALAPSLDASMVHRSISRKYQAVYADAFTESSAPSNEEGLFMGLSFRPSTSVRVDAFTDMYRFPWLRYRVDAPSIGREYLVSFTYKPNKIVEFSFRYRDEYKALNQSGNLDILPVIETGRRQSWRIHSEVKFSRELVMRYRCELGWVKPPSRKVMQGFLNYVDFLYKPPLKSWSGNVRMLYFETEGYDARLYAYENDVLYSLSIPPLFGKGFRYYLNFHVVLSSGKFYHRNRRIGVESWFRFAGTIYSGQPVISSGLDEIMGTRKSECKLQFIFTY